MKPLVFGTNSLLPVLWWLQHVAALLCTHLAAFAVWL